eukprot:9454193-Pyramimonas_sp.AAC.1
MEPIRVARVPLYNSLHILYHLKRAREEIHSPRTKGLRCGKRRCKRKHRASIYPSNNIDRS